MCRKAGLVVRVEKTIGEGADGAARIPDIEIELGNTTAYVDVSGTATPSCAGGEFLVDAFVTRTEQKVCKYTDVISHAGNGGVFRAFIFSAAFFAIDESSEVHSAAFLKEVKNVVTADDPHAKLDLPQFYHDLAASSIRLWAISSRRFMRTVPTKVRKVYGGRKAHLAAR